MAITYTWKVTGVKTQDVGSLSSAVIQTYWEKTGTDENGVEGKFSGATPLKVNPNAENFTPFSELTEAQVLAWIQAEAVKYEDHINEQIQKQIDAKTSPVQENVTLPWGE